MPKLLQINVTANWGSTGRIAEDIGRLAIDDGWESWIAFGRGKPESRSHLIPIGNDWDMKFHGLQTRIFDNHGLASKRATKKFIEQIEEISPDIIHLHNIHGYYLNYVLLFDFLKEWGGPVVWTLHDCWPFTGHCSHYSYKQCYKWQDQCQNCPQKHRYPASFGIDRSKKNFLDKRISFLGLNNLTIVPVSNWLHGELSKSFLKDYPAVTIHNGINLSIFKPSASSKNKEGKIILGVASVWDDRKGLGEFLELREILPADYSIILVGLTPDRIAKLPDGVIGITRTENVEQLAKLYSEADVYVNPTLEDNFPTTNLEALACGTPVITYQTGGSPEAINSSSGIVVETGNIEELAKAVNEVIINPSNFSREACRQRAELCFNQDIQFEKYVDMYDSLINKD